MFMLPEGTMISAFIGGAISKVINDGVDYSKSKIKRVINDEHDQNISTKICRVIESALNTVTDNVYKNSDDLYDAIEKILNEFKIHGDSIESVKCGLRLLSADVSDQRCRNFLDKFHEGFCQDEDLYKRISLVLDEKEIKISQEGFQKINDKLDNLTEIVSSTNDNKIENQKREPVKSRTQEYADKWNENMFLNNFDKRDENAGVNVKLREVYLEEHLPNYIWKGNQKISTDLKDLLKENIYPSNDNQMLLIFGQPGIGKSTLITWITANYVDRVDDILVYKFASDLGDIDWHSAKLLNRILEELGLDYNDLNGKTIILDGLDEVSIDDRMVVLDELYDNLINKNGIKEFSLIITCRENYVRERERVKGNYITLQPWDEAQIRSFCDVFEEKTQKNASESAIEKLIENRAILGIPLILYMTLALNITIEKEESIVDIYDKIFSLDGGIYDRCINNKNFADKHRIAGIKEQIHQISRNIAVWMFENEPEETYIPKEEYQKICDNVMQKQKQKNEAMEQDFLIGNFFKLVRHCEGIETEELYFVHRSIYEYFVAETIYFFMSKAVNESEESLACVFGRLLKRNRLSKEILAFLGKKIKKSTLDKMFDKINASFQLMLQDGMTSNTNECYINVIDCEMNVFANMLEIIHLWNKDYYELHHRIVYYIKIYIIMYGIINDNMLNCTNVDLSEADFDEIDLTYIYLINAKLNRAKLNRVNLSITDLRGVSLVGASLIETSLTRSHLIGADLTGADLTGADLRMADLTGADLTGADLRMADLTGACLDEKQISYLKQSYDLKDTRVYIAETGEIISYDEYCERKH